MKVLEQGIDRIMPHNLDAERAVLGSCLLDKDAAIYVIETLRKDDFYDAIHQLAYDIISEMVQKDKAVDPLTFIEEAKKRGLFDKLGGQSFVASLIDAVPTTANVEYHARIVRDKSVHRKMIQVGTYITKLGYAEEAEIEEVLDEAERAVFDVATRGNLVVFKALGEVLKSSFKELEDRFFGGSVVTGLPTGYIDLDRITGGLQGGSLIILAARPSMGKTALALNIAQYVAIKQETPVLIFSLEMSAEQLSHRLLASEAKVNIHDMRTGALPRGTWDILANAAGMLSEAPIYIDDSSFLSTLDLRARARRFKAQHPKLGLIIVDYLQLMNLSRRVENKQQEVAEISRALKGVARELNVPVIALSQLSRAVEQRQDKKPQLADLRDSGAIEQDADLVIFLYRKGYYEPDKEDGQDVADLIIAKHRNGPTGTVQLLFVKEYTRFENFASWTLSK
ncbi:MAG TPA: replicative DNA helicase [Acetomicrobium flavidum]|uniref:replicative DNA helicase n=1 Tax=Acetomicrobium flavidum TaxID=49896 RepID=UPI001FE16ECD|nr:replicative DNA helicase [Acetomicrobium mobile]HOJ81481.1 replicative DNA helicase [Acetomicrobium flavidum]HOM30491.1 replicative DNA helicase [Acetomicrobium flavidum]HPP13648.1 replicative DNA helicase [Acetomicrobium flavidum]